MNELHQQPPGCGGSLHTVVRWPSPPRWEEVGEPVPEGVCPALLVVPADELVLCPQALFVTPQSGFVSP